MPTLTLADYAVLEGGSFTLDSASSNRERTLIWPIPNNLTFGTNLARLILAFKVRVLEDSSFRVFVNSREVMSFSLDESVTRGYWETFSARTAFPEGASFPNDNPVRFVVSTGEVRIEDVIMWYQVNVDV
jgi:hypothetical protein